MATFDLLTTANRAPVTEEEARETMAACMILEGIADEAEMAWADHPWILYAIGANGDERPFFVGITKDIGQAFFDHLTTAQSPRARDVSPVAARIDAEMPQGVWIELLQWGMCLGDANRAADAFAEQMLKSGYPVMRLKGLVPMIE